MPQLLARSLSALDAIFTRRSVRAYTDAVLDEATIQSLLDAAVQAPTAVHAEPWGFVIIQDKAVLKRVSDRAKGRWTEEVSHYRDLHRDGDPEMSRAFAERVASPDFCLFYDAGTLVVICATARGPFAAVDCWLAAGTLMLAATALGLGTCCIGSAIPALNSRETKAELGIPPNVEVVVPIVVGVPRESATPVSRRAPQILSWIRPSR